MESKEVRGMTNNKELFLTWTKNLYQLRWVALVGTLIASLPFVGAWFGWVNTLISVVILFVIYKLSPVNDRYRKAAIFMGISIVLGVLVKTEILNMLSFVASICSLIAVYQEYCGHAEMMTGIDEKLSRSWHTLFNWNIIGGILIGAFGSITTVLAGVALVLDANIIAGIVLGIVLGFEVIIQIFYLRFLKRTREVYEHYEPQTDEVDSEEI